jgi:hypothetical protein
MGVKVGVAVGKGVFVGEGVLVGAIVSVGSGDGSSVADGSGKRVLVESNRGASRVEVMGGSTAAGVVLTGRLQAGMVRSKTKITEIRFMSLFIL